MIPHVRPSRWRWSTYWSLFDSEAWWDPPTGVVVVSQGYQTGGCLCLELGREHIWRAPRP